MSNLKFVRAMFTSNGMELQDIGPELRGGLKGISDLVETE
jgi:hypothetical protein